MTSGQAYRFGEFELDTTAYELRRKGRRLRLARQPKELLLLLLVAVAALTPIYAISAQDISRLCLTRSLLEGRLGISPCVGHAFDQARVGRRFLADAAGRAA